MHGADEPHLDDLLAELTLAEKVSLVAGDSLWRTPGVERLGIAPLKMTDGPNGARGERWYGSPATCMPCGSAVAATWDPALAHEVGRAIGEDARDRGAHLLLAPTVNLHRHPLGGRSFECASEDPVLTARMAVGFVRGVQSTGVGATVKHYVANDTEFERMTISSEVDERTLREVYLVPFEAAVREAGAWAVMASYNRVNGTYAAEHLWALGDVLKGEWGFDGVVVSDWFGTHSTIASALAGLDVEMPGPAQWFGTKLADAVSSGEVPVSTLDDMVRRVLRLRARCRATGGERSRTERLDEHPDRTALARRAAVDAMVLLRNEGVLLPLDLTGVSSIALVGPNALQAVIQGGGSAQLTPHRAVTPVEGLRTALEGTGVALAVERGCSIAKRAPALTGEITVTYRSDDGPPVVERVRRAHFMWLGERPAGVGPRFTAEVATTFTPDDGGDWTLALTAVGAAELSLDGRVVVAVPADAPRGDAFFTFGSVETAVTVPLEAGRPVELQVRYTAAGGIDGLTLGVRPPEPAELLDRAVAAAAAAGVAVVVVGTTEEWESEGHDRTSLALPGDQRELIERVAAVQPRTVVVVNAGAPVDYGWRRAVPAIVHAWFAGQEWGHALADVLLGRQAPGGRLPTTFPERLEDTPAFTSYPGECGAVRYAEGLFVGHRWYDARRIEPAFPFGHGLATTTFAWAAPEVHDDGETVTVRVAVTNTGPRHGAEVVQCYVRPPSSPPGAPMRPPQELKAFAKVRLDPGATGWAELVLDRRAFAHWSPASRAWEVAPGTYTLALGTSSRSIVAELTVERSR